MLSSRASSGRSLASESPIAPFRAPSIRLPAGESARGSPRARVATARAPATSGAFSPFPTDQYTAREMPSCITRTGAPTTPRVPKILSAAARCTSLARVAGSANARPPSSPSARVSSASANLDPQECCFHVAQAIHVAPHPGHGVVEQEGLRELDDRVAEGGGIHRRVVVARPLLGLDQLGDHRDDARLDRPRARADDADGGIALVLHELTQGGDLGEAAVEAVEGVEQGGPAAATRFLARVLQQGL